MSRYSGENTLLQIFDNIKEKCDALSDKIKGKQDALEWDSTPTQGSQNPITSDGVYSALQNVGGNGGGGEDEVVWVTCFLDLSTMQIMDMSHTYEELAPLVGKKVMKVVVDYGHGICVGDWAVKNGTYALMSQVMIRSDLGAGLGLYYFCIELKYDNTISIDPRIIDSTSLGG